jgi:uncharacterized protein YcbX
VHISQLWRYPVKSMAGERLDVADVSLNGITGDRSALVVRGGRIVTSRTHPKLLAHRGGIDANGSPTADGFAWDSREAAAIAVDAAGDGAALIRYEGPERFDVLPLLIATDGAIAALGEDSRRIRPNIIIGGVEGLAEREWEARRIRAGGAIIHIDDLRQRCVMTTWDPDTQQQNISVLKKIVRDFDGRIALNCAVEVAGIVRIGDPVEFI